MKISLLSFDCSINTGAFQEEETWSSQKIAWSQRNDVPMHHKNSRAKKIASKKASLKKICNSYNEMTQKEYIETILSYCGMNLYD